jgi:hypothetical protein
LTSKVVATSTVVAAVPILPPVARLAIALALNSVDEALVKVEPVAIVKPPLAVISPLKVGLLTIVIPEQLPPEPRVITSPPPVRLPVPVGQVRVVLP